MGIMTEERGPRKGPPAPGKGDARDHAGAARGLAPVKDQDEREAAAPGNAAPPDHPDAVAEEVAVRLRTLDLDDDEAEELKHGGPRRATEPPEGA